MNPKEIVQLNNEKREKLTQQNLAYYEDMLVYIRTSSNKSEQQTEEVLLELLDHLLDAQAEGRTAEDVFGTDPKAYCQNLISEIPHEKRSKQISFFVYVAIQFLASMGIAFGVIGFGLNYFFDLGSTTTTVFLGSWAVIIFIYLFIGYLFIIILLKWLKSSSFKQAKNPKGWLGFFQLWVILFIFLTIFMFTPKLMPDFGVSIEIPIVALAGVGVILYLGSYIMNKKKGVMK